MAFAFPPDGPATITGTVAEFGPDGTPAGAALPYVATQISSAAAFSVSGHVYAATSPDGSPCSKPACPGVGGVKVLVAGMSSDGSAVSVTAVSAPTTGAWSVTVPAGSYTAGPTLNGSSFDPAGQFSPTEQAVTIGNENVAGVDFIESSQRPVNVAMFCEYRPKSFISFTKVSTQSCFVTVSDAGPPPHQNPAGTVRFRSLARLVGIIDPNPCTLTDSVSDGVAECQVTLDPGSKTKVGDTLGVEATFSPSTATFKSGSTQFTSVYTPFLDPTNKVTAARAEAHFISIIAASAALSKTPAAPVAVPTGIVATVMAAPLHYLQLPDEPPDRDYAQVFRPRILRSRAMLTSGARAVALRALNRNDRAIEGWAAAEWNTLNRSVIAREKNNRTAFVTQMTAASKNELELATLVSRLPAEMTAVERASSRKDRAVSISVSRARLAQVKKKAATLSVAQRRFYVSIGLAPSLVSKLVTAGTKHVTRSSVDGNAFAKLNAWATTASRVAGFLRRVSAIHAAMARLYS